MTKTVLILGASGKFGKHSANTFRAAGWTVRLYDRKAGNMTAAAMGADVIVNGLNPPNYHNWVELLPAITRQVIEAAKASGATVILPGNVYVFGNHPGIFDTTTPHRATTKKGRIRMDLEAAYRAAAKDGVQTINLRAGDLIDPASEDTVFDKVMLTGLKRGKLQLLGDPEAKHAYCFTPDWARAALQLAEIRDRLSLYEDVPMPGPTLRGTEIRDHLEQLFQRPIRITQFNWGLLTLVAPFWELARELREMRYLWDLPHEISGEKLYRLLPEFRLTPPEEVIRAALPDDVHPDKVMTAAFGT